MRLLAFSILTTATLLTGAIPAAASALEVAPVKLQVEMPAAAATITLSNPGTAPVTAQLRVFKWSHKDGKDMLQATRDVVASPPLTRLAPGEPYVVRIVRMAPAPVSGEESYRLIVDEIPNLAAAQPAFGPRFAIRQSIPVFFTDPAATARLTWRVHADHGNLVIEAANEGGKRVRISALNIVNGSGKATAVGNGFAGYVFAHSTERWTARQAAKGLQPGSTITIIAQGENGPIKATAQISAAN